MFVRMLLALSLTLIPVSLEGPYATRPDIGGPVSPDGKVEVTTDLPAKMRHANRGGSNGAGLCVFASLDHAALYQNDPVVIGIFQKMFKEPGGGWPDKVTRIMAKYCPGARYVQYVGKDVSIVQAALKTGRMPCVMTDGGSHMINTVYLGTDWACVLDNNFVGVNQLRWYRRKEWNERVWLSAGNGWAIVLLHPRPPAPPRNGGAKMRKSTACMVAACLAGVATCGVASDAGEPDVRILPRTNGVVIEQVAERGERWEVNGKPSSRDEALAAIQAGEGVPDDSAWPSLTFIGADDVAGVARRRVETHPATKDLAARYLVQQFRPSNPLVADAGFVTTGEPTIYGQRPDGTVMFRLDSLPDMGIMSATMAAGLPSEDGCRKPDPAYQPVADPGAVLPIKPQVNADVTPAPWLLILSHAASVFVGGLGALGGRWALVAMFVEPMMQSLEARLLAKIPPPASAAATPAATPAG